MRAFLALLLGFLAACSVVSAQETKSVYQTKYRVVNIHRHCATPTEEAMRAELEVMERVGLSVVVILDGGSPAGSLPSWMQLKQKFCDRLVVFYKLDFGDIRKETFFADIVRDLERAAKMGVQGVKVWKDLGMYVRDRQDKLLKADDERLDRFWARCGELGLPVLIHAADPKEYWYPLTYNSFHYGLRDEKDQHYHNAEMPTWVELIRQRDAILKKHPKTEFIGAHMGSLCFDLKQLDETLDRYPNFHVDCAARLRILGRLNPPAVRDFFVKYQDRILFGTDDMVLFKGRKVTGSRNISIYPSDDPNWLWVDPADRDGVRRWQDRAVFNYGLYLQYFETDRLDLLDPNHSGGSWLRISGVKLPAEVLEKFYHANAERLIAGLKHKE